MDGTRTTGVGRTCVAAAAGCLLLAVAAIPPAGAAVPRAVDLGQEVLADGDGWASYRGATVPEYDLARAEGTTGGARAAAADIYVVDTWQELRTALSGGPGDGVRAEVDDGTAPRIVYVTGPIDAFTDRGGNALTCDDFGQQVTVGHSGRPFSMDDYIAQYDPLGPWGWVDPYGPMEEARQEAAAVQARQTQLDIGSDVTLVGVGDEAAVSGASLQIRDAHNVIVRNLRLSDARDCFPAWQPGLTDSGSWVAAYDNLTVWTSYSVWVDHNTFDDGATATSAETVYGRPFEVHDGLLDITHGSDLVTVSHNRFEQHDRTALVGSSDGRYQDREQHRVTYHHNHWVDVGQRAPRVRFGDVHIYNDFYEQTDEGNFEYYWGAGYQSSIYAENNAFALADGVDPARIIAGLGGTQLLETGSLVDGTPVDLVSAFNATAPEPLRPAARWQPGDAYAYELTPTSEVPTSVPRQAGAGVLESGAVGATGPPRSVRITHDTWGGRFDRTFTVSVTVPGGQRATVVKLYQDGDLVQARRLGTDGRGPQRASFAVVGQEPGRYTYVAEALNPYGPTTSRDLVVTVR